MISNLGLQAEVVKEFSNSLVDILAMAGPSKVALPLNEAIVDLLKALWQPPDSLSTTSKRGERKYFVHTQGYEFLYAHPSFSPGSLVVSVANEKERQGLQVVTSKAKDSKKLDLFISLPY